MNYAFSSYCRNVVNAWSGGVADSKRNRLIIWGGGHGDYSGNEVYSLNLASTPPALVRLTDPSVFDPNSCPDANVSDGTPVSRHTYNNLVYLPKQDWMFSFDGGKAPCGSPSTHTWTLDLSAPVPKWHAMDPVNGFNPVGGNWQAYAVCAYDPNSQTVICNASDTFLRYNPGTNTYTRLSTQHVPFSATGVVDPVRKLMIFMGHEYQATAPLVKVVDLSRGSNFTLKDWSSQVTGCNVLAGADYPGLQYDPVLDRIVGWPGRGNTVYLFDPDTKTCTAQTFANGPQNTSINGTFGRFQYFPGLDAFALVNQASSDAFLLKLSSPGVTAGGLNAKGAGNVIPVRPAVR